MGRKVKKREEKQSKKVEHNKRGKKDKKRTVIMKRWHTYTKRVADWGQKWWRGGAQ